VCKCLGEDNENCGDEIWLPCSNGKLDRLAFSSTNWFHYRSINVSHKITAICTIDDHSVWLGDAGGQIHSYSFVIFIEITYTIVYFNFN